MRRSAGQHGAGPARRRYAARRGLSFLEIVAASAILAMVAATIIAGVNSILSRHQREQHRLAAMELANRMVLQYLDDKDAMPSPALPIGYGKSRYRWSMRTSPVRLIPARADAAAERAGVSTENLLESVTITVWLSEESGGSSSFDARYPSATVTRVVDPVAAMTRNPDSFKRLSQNPEAYRRYLQMFSNIGSRSPGAGRRQGGSQPSNPVTTPGRPSPSGGGGGT